MNYANKETTIAQLYKIVEGKIFLFVTYKFCFLCYGFFNLFIKLIDIVVCR